MRDLLGQHFGKLVVIRHSEKRKDRRILWECLCDCGNTTYLTSSALISGNTKSCGCWNFEHSQKGVGWAALNRLYSRYEKSARARKLLFEISIEEFASIISLNCYYCGQPPSSGVHEHGKSFNGNILYNGIDRFDNFIGYTLSNCVPCCSLCNYAKRDLDYSQFISWANRLHEGITERAIRKALGRDTQSIALSGGVGE